MTKEREALKLALAALEYHTVQTRPIAASEAAITAIKEALEQPEQEPVGHIYTIAGVQHCTIEQVLPDGPLYTTPPKREWVGLTDDERNAIEAVTLGLHGIPSFFATAIEAKLKEKNHD